MIMAHIKVIIRLPGNWTADRLKHAIASELRLALPLYCDGAAVEPAVTIEYISAGES